MAKVPHAMLFRPSSKGVALAGTPCQPTSTLFTCAHPGAPLFLAAGSGRDHPVLLSSAAGAHTPGRDLPFPGSAQVQAPFPWGGTGLHSARADSASRCHCVPSRWQVREALGTTACFQHVMRMASSHSACWVSGSCCILITACGHSISKQSMNHEERGGGEGPWSRIAVPKPM